jgi:peptide-methionine (R)-S-oxide reductase
MAPAPALERSSRVAVEGRRLAVRATAGPVLAPGPSVVVRSSAAAATNGQQKPRDDPMNRRRFLSRTLLAISGVSVLPRPIFAQAQAPAVPAAKIDKIVKTEAEWRKLLTPAQFVVLRQEGTERAFTSPLNNEKRKGIYACVGCELPLFDSQTKYDSGTGWPSFYDHLPGSIETTKDFKPAFFGVEYHCARCGGHHGHIFEDGPKPTGLRHCNNGVVLKFIPA